MHVLGISVGVGTAVRAPEGERDAPSSPRKPPPGGACATERRGAPHLQKRAEAGTSKPESMVAR